MEERMREGRSREKERHRARKRGKSRTERWRQKEKTNSATITSLHQMIAFFSYESQEKLSGEWTMREGRRKNRRSLCYQGKNCLQSS